MATRLSNSAIGDFIVACLRDRVEDFIRRMGDEIELPSRFLQECRPLSELVSQGKLRLAVDNKTLTGWGDFIQLMTNADNEFFVRISLVNK